MSKVIGKIAVVAIVCGLMACGDTGTGPDGQKILRDFPAEKVWYNVLVFRGCDRDSVLVDIDGPVEDPADYPHEISEADYRLFRGYAIQGVEGERYRVMLRHIRTDSVLMDTSITWQPDEFIKQGLDCPPIQFPCWPRHELDCP